MAEAQSARLDQVSPPAPEAEADRAPDDCGLAEGALQIGAPGDRLDVWKAVHRALRDEAIRATESGTPLSLMILSIDAPRQLTDAAGPRLRELLVAAARAVHANTDTDGLPWIYGTHRFVFILPETELAGAQGKVRQLRACIAPLCSPAQESSVDTALAVSVGAAEYTPQESLGHFIQRAIDALAAER